MSTIFTILFLVPFWSFGRFWSRMLHEYDLVLDSVADKTVEIYSDKIFCYRTWEQWHSEMKLMKILGIVYFSIFSIATVVAILSITILLVCISIIGMGVIALFMGIFRHLPY